MYRLWCFITTIFLFICANISYGQNDSVAEFNVSVEVDLQQLSSYDEQNSNKNAVTFNVNPHNNEGKASFFIRSTGKNILPLALSLISDMPFNGGIPQDRNIFKAFMKPVKDSIYGKDYEIYFSSEAGRQGEFVFASRFSSLDSRQRLQNIFQEYQLPQLPFIFRGFFWDSIFNALIIYEVTSGDSTDESDAAERELKMYIASLAMVTLYLLTRSDIFIRLGQSFSSYTFAMRGVSLGQSARVSYMIVIPTLFFTKYSTPLNQNPLLRSALLLFPTLIYYTSSLLIQWHDVLKYQ